MATNPITHQSAMEYTMSQSARSMMPNQSMSTLLRAFALMSVAGMAVPTLAAGPQKGSQSFNQGNRAVDSRAGTTPATSKQAYEDQQILSGRLILRVTSINAFNAELEAVLQDFPGLIMERPIDADNGIYLFNAGTPADAVRASQSLMGLASVERVDLEQARQNGVNRILQALEDPRVASRLNNNRDTARRGFDFPGVRPLPSDFETPRGTGTDPLFGSMWHFNNTLDGDPNLNPDNNLTSNIYNTMGLSGAGVTIGLASEGINSHLDTDHTELVGNYSSDLSMPFDPVLFPDSTAMTALAGIMAAAVDGVNVQGVAPSASVGTFTWPFSVGSIPFQEYEAYNWKLRDLDIKLYDTATGWYNSPNNSYNIGSIDEFVQIPLRNSYAFGRNRKGTVNIFSAGMNAFAPLDVALGGLPKWPDPYNFPPAASADSWSPLDELFNSGGNQVAITLTNGYTSGPYYPNGQVTYYGPANDRRSFIFGTVGEGRASMNPEEIYADIYSAQGTSVFASFYGASTNFFQGGAQSIGGRGVLTSVPGASNIAVFPATTETVPSGNEALTGSAIGAGVIALMLEANPNLSIRDIQHILFESIQESPKDARIKWPNFDVNRAYVSQGSSTPGTASFWQVNSALYNGGTVTNQAIRHSDLYGFGVVDAELAVQKAMNWGGTAPLIVLDTGFIGTGDDGDFELEIPTPEYFIAQEPDGETGTNGSAFMVGTQPVFLPTFCVRQNIKIEAIVVDVTITGAGASDLFITLSGPNTTRSVLHMPSTLNVFGTSDPDFPLDDDVDSAGTLGGNALLRHSFLTWKHWGELSAGDWNVSFADYGVDEAMPVGVEPETGMDPTPGADMVIDLGFFGVPGSAFRSEKTVTEYRFRIFGTDIGQPVFEGCNPLETSCPADLNGDGVVDVQDLQIFIQYFQDGNAVADINGDGSVDYADLLIYRGLWSPGFCDNNAFGGGRPRPGDTNAGDDNNPSSRPI
jgi:hypothetical protein